MAGRLSHRLTTSDSAFLYMERPTAPLHIGSVGIYEGQVDAERFISHIESRMPNIPRYRQRIAPVPFQLAHATWEDDPNFSVRNHIHQVQLPAPGTEDQLAVLAAELFSTPLSRTRPLWEMFVVNGLEGDRSAMVSKVHHCMVDGVSGIDLLMQVVDLTAEPAPPPPPDNWKPRPLPSSSERLIDAFWDNIEEQRQAADDALRRLMDPQRTFNEINSFSSAMRTAVPWVTRPAPKLHFNDALSARRRVAWASMSFSEIRDIRTTLGGTVNDVVLAVLAGTLRRYLIGRGDDVNGLELRVAIPVNIRLEDQKGALGNRISGMFVELPVGEADVIERFRMIRERMDSLKSDNQAGAIEMLMRTGTQVPAPLQALFGAMSTAAPINMICTNVPGPMIPLFCVGHLLLDHYPLVPLSMNLGMGCGVTSYNHRLFFGLTVEPNLVPDYKALSGCADGAFLELRDAAGVDVTDLPIFTGSLMEQLPQVPAQLSARQQGS